jgi:hypothetical protein
MVFPEPAMLGSIPEKHQAFLGSSGALFPVFGRPSLSFGRHAFRPADSADRFSGDPDLFDGDQFLGAMGVVEFLVLVRNQLKNPRFQKGIQRITGRLSSIAVTQSSGTVSGESCLEPLGMAVGHPQARCGFPQADPPIKDQLEEIKTIQLLLTHKYFVLSHNGDILALQLEGT